MTDGSVRIGLVRFIPSTFLAGESHVRVAVRSGPEGHGALMGTLTMRAEEWEGFSNHIERLERVAEAARGVLLQSCGSDSLAYGWKATQATALDYLSAVLDD